MIMLNVIRAYFELILCLSVAIRFFLDKSLEFLEVEVKYA